MKKYMWKCVDGCGTIMSIETDIPFEKLHKYPPCPCGKQRMICLASAEYAYGKDYKGGWD